MRLFLFILPVAVAFSARSASADVRTRNDGKRQLPVTVRKLFWLALLVAVGSLHSTFAQTSPPYPEIVQTAIGEARKDCPGAVTKPGFVTEQDINGDSRKDYILNYGSFLCGESGSTFCGSAGCMTEVFASLSDGTYAKVLGENVRRVTFRTVKGRPAMILDLHGSACGRAGSEPCQATLYWNGFKFSPAN